MGEWGDSFKRLETAARLTPSRRAASAGLFPSRINCKSVSSLIFFFAMDTSWKHHGNFWFTAVIVRLSLKMSSTNIFDSTTRAAKRAREVGPAVRVRRAKAEGSGLSSHLAEPSLRSGSRVTSSKRVKRFKFAADLL